MLIYTKRNFVKFRNEGRKANDKKTYKRIGDGNAYAYHDNQYGNTGYSTGQSGWRSCDRISLSQGRW